MNEAPQADELEELAAFIDGKLTGEARTRMVARLAASEELYAVFAETVRFQEETARFQEGAAATPEPAPPLTHPRTVVGWKPWAGVAAAVAAMVIVVLGWSLLRANLMTPAGPRLAVLVDSEVYRQESTQITSLLAEGQLWSGNRGGTTACPGSAKKSAFCIGVWVVDLHAALEVGDRELAAETARRLDLQLSEGMDEFFLVPYYAFILDQLERDTPLNDLLLESGEADTYLGELLGEYEDLLPFYALGRWTEGAWIAVRLGAVDYFQQRAVRRFPATLDDVEFSEPSRKSLAALDSQLQAGVGVADLPAVKQYLAHLLTNRGTDRRPLESAEQLLVPPTIEVLRLGDLSTEGDKLPGLEDSHVAFALPINDSRPLPGAAPRPDAGRL